MTFGSFGDPFKVGFSLSTDVFRRPRTGGGRAFKKPEPAAEAEPEPLADDGTVDDSAEEKEKNKVVLKNPKWEIEKVGFNEETDISVDATIPEGESKTKVSFELFAKTPNGPENISKADANAESGKAKAKIPVYMPQFKDEEGNLLSKVEYYFTAKHSLSDLLKDESVVKVVDHMADLLIDCHILDDVTFATDKSQVRPGQAAVLKTLCDRIKEWKEKHADGKLAVFGHADAVGKEEPNKKLSERRAAAIHAFLIKDAAAWEALAKEEKWNKKTIPDFQAFMDENNTLSLTDKDFDAIDGKPHAGCSEFNQVEAKKGASEANRRVSVFLLKSNKNFPIQYPCKHGDIAPCKAQVGRKGERRTPGFGCLFYDKLVVEQKGGCGADAGKVKFIGITEAEYRQYVNMEPEEGKPEHGMDRLIEVEVEGLSDGDEVYWTVTVGADNSKRTDPKTGPKLTAEEEVVEFKEGIAALVSTVAEGKTSILLACGVAGGDEFTVEVGASREKMEGKVKIITWRKLEFETIHPKAKGNDRLTDYTVFTADKGPGLPNGTQAHLDKVLGKGFVEFKEIHKDCYLLEDLPDDGKWNVLDGKTVQKDHGKKVVVATRDQLDNARVFHGKVSSNNRAVSIIWCDYMGEPQAWRQKFTHLSKEANLVPNVRVFENAIDGGHGLSQGDFYITSLKWAVTHWYDPTKPRDEAWRPVNSADDPGYAFRNGGTLTDKDEIKAHLRYDHSFQVTALFPEDKAHYPGKKLTRDASYNFVDKGKILGISYDVTGVGLNTQFVGYAWKGKIWMNTSATAVDPVGVAVVLAHELGHNMGQGYGDKAVDATRGRSAGNAIPGIDFPKPVPDGNKYGEHGHRGVHCATGVVDKTAADFSWRSGSQDAYNEHQCIMFGATSIDTSTDYNYCDECITFIRGEQLTDIRKEWAA